MSAPNRSTTSQTGLARVLNFWEVTASGVGIIVGAGIYVLIGEATERAGAGVWMAFVLSAGLAGLTALCYAELTSMFPRASAEFEYTRQAFSESIAFSVGWVMVAGLAVGAAAVSLGFARYVRHFADLDERAVAVALLAVIATVGAGGIKNSARLTLLLSSIQVGGLVFVVALGLDHVGDVDLLETRGTGAVLGAAALVFFAFIGFDEVITLAEETRNPTRVVPRALLTALGVSTILYVLVAVVSVSVLGAARLGESEAPLADVMGHAVGGISPDVVAVIALISTFNTTLLALTAASRLSYGIASSGALPRWVALVNRRQAPYSAIVATATLAAGFVLVRDIALIASITDAAVYCVFIAVNATVIALRVRRPGLERPFRIPGTVGAVPVVPLLALAGTLVMMTHLEWRSLVVGGVVIGVGQVARALMKRHAAQGPQRR